MGFKCGDINYDYYYPCCLPTTIGRQHCIISLGFGALLLFTLTVEVIKKRLLMSAISGKLADLEGGNEVDKFSATTGGLIDYVDEIHQKSGYTNPDQGDPIYRLFKWSYARQYLTYITFVAGILVSILTEWEFIKYLCQLHYGQWLNIPLYRI
jgi:hypothetical protein